MIRWIPEPALGGLEVERVGSLESKDATRIRVKWYVALAVFNASNLAKLTEFETSVRGLGS